MLPVPETEPQVLLLLLGRAELLGLCTVALALMLTSAEALLQLLSEEEALGLGCRAVAEARAVLLALPLAVAAAEVPEAAELPLKVALLLLQELLEALPESD